MTPLDLAAAYAVFANGGYRVQPYFIDRIEDASGQVVWQAAPRRRLRRNASRPRTAPRVPDAAGRAGRCSQPPTPCSGGARAAAGRGSSHRASSAAQNAYVMD